MIEINIGPKTISQALELASDLKRLNNSIEGGGGNAAGLIGEVVCAAAMGGRICNTYNYDIKTSNGLTVDAKTKRCSSKPCQEYECSVAAFNTFQKCDIYAFVRILNNYSKAWFLGWMKKVEYFEKAKFMKKGQIDPANGFSVRADCYNLKICELSLENVCIP